MSGAQRGPRWNLAQHGREQRQQTIGRRLGGQQQGASRATLLRAANSQHTQPDM